MISNFGQDEEFYLSFWREGVNPVKLDWWTRLKLCFLVLFKGNYYEDQVVLDTRTAGELAVWINSRIQWNICRKRDKELLGNHRNRSEVKQTYEDWGQ